MGFPSTCYTHISSSSLSSRWQTFFTTEEEAAIDDAIKSSTNETERKRKRQMQQQISLIPGNGEHCYKYVLFIRQYFSPAIDDGRLGDIQVTWSLKVALYSLLLFPFYLTHIYLDAPRYTSIKTLMRCFRFPFMSFMSKLKMCIKQTYAVFVIKCKCENNKTIKSFPSDWTQNFPPDYVGKYEGKLFLIHRLHHLLSSLSLSVSALISNLWYIYKSTGHLKVKYAHF